LIRQRHSLSLMNQYRVELASPAAHLFRVILTVPRPHPEGQPFALPAWIFGSYLIRDFAKHVVRLDASAGGVPVPMRKLDKQTWQCAPVSGPLRLEYEVYAFDLSVRGAYMDTTRAYFNGSSLFLRVVGQEQTACELQLPVPPFEGSAAWEVATTMPGFVGDRRGFGSYTAAGYYELIDHPVEIAALTKGAFEVADTPHQISFSGRQQADLPRVVEDLRKICRTHIALFGELPKMERYLFQVLAVGEGYGGLEHATSCSLLCSRDDLPRPGDPGLSEGYKRFLGLCSHEYFHLWQVKRIQPEVFRQADLSQEVHTTLLWAFEGITSYYDDLALVRSGVIDPKAYLGLLAETVSRVTRGAGRLKQTLAEASFDAWIKFYKPDENAPNANVSYYAKGALVALALDLKIRLESAGRHSLDDVMRALWAEYGRSGRGVPEDGVERLAGVVTGLPLQPFFDQAIRSTQDLPLAELLREFGISMRLRPAKGEKDFGGFVEGVESATPTPRPTLGVKCATNGPELRLLTVFDDGPAQRAGLSAGDQLVAIDGIRVTLANLDQRLAAISGDAEVEVHAFRRDEMMTFRLRPQAAPADTCELAFITEPSSCQAERRKAWLQPALPTPTLAP
jgi:predicted metalloprotease with PDZ domain